MEMHQIRYFLAVADELNFTRAAEKCNVTQPSLTRAINVNRRGVPTPIGTLSYRSTSPRYAFQNGVLTQPRPIPEVRAPTEHASNAHLRYRLIGPVIRGR